MHNKLILGLLASTILFSCSQNDLTPNIISESNIVNKSSTSNAKKVYLPKKSNTKRITIAAKLPVNLSPATKSATDAISKVLSGAELISEADYEFTVDVWQNLNIDKFTPALLLKQLKLNSKLKCEDQKETISKLMGDYATKKYWEGSGYSQSEINEKITKYKAFIKETTTQLKVHQIFLVDDPANLEDSSYDPKENDYSGEVGVYVLGKIGNDWVVLKSAYVWT